MGGSHQRKAAPVVAYVLRRYKGCGRWTLRGAVKVIDHDVFGGCQRVRWESDPRRWETVFRDNLYWTKEAATNAANARNAQEGRTDD